MLALSIATYASGCASTHGDARGGDVPPTPPTPEEDAAAPAPGGADAGSDAAVDAGDAARPAPPLRTIGADDPRLRYSGRIDFSDPKAPQFSAPAVHVTLAFHGTAIAVRLQDEHRYGSDRNYFDALVDDAPPVRIRTDRGAQTYPIAEGLADRDHVLTLVKRTEASVGWTRLLGFDVRGDLAPPPPAPAHRIAFYGDSITAGSGDEAKDGSPQCTEEGWGQPYENANLAYGPTLARALDADYQLTAVSGIGLVRNYSAQYDARTMPEVYDLLYTEETSSPKWDATKYVPDAIVVALGTNDFSVGDSPRPSMKVDDFSAAYARFLGKLRADSPNAAIFCVSSPMLGDGYPTASDTFLTDQKTAIAKTVDAMHAAGDARVYPIYVTKQIGTGCGTHPSVAQQAATAAEIAPIVRAAMGW